MAGSQTDGGLTRSITFTIYNVHGPGEYLLGGHMNVFGGTAEFCCWQSANAGSVGSISVTPITVSRIKGTFSATLKPTAGKPATGDLLIENGTFDAAMELGRLGQLGRLRRSGDIVPCRPKIVVKFR